MAVAIIANAMMFHSRIEGQQGIQLLSALVTHSVITKESVISCWNWIVSNVNYWPIFKFASDLLNVIPIAPANLILGQRKQAVEIFEEFIHKSFLPANEAYRDETRIALDRAVLVDLLNCTEDILEPLAVHRNQWSAEPSVHGGKSTRPRA